MGTDTRWKVFPDPIYGHIRIPGDFCSQIIDTAIFQRLRHIEQTSIRSIFPCANHTRFTHSLGTFHIGQQIFSRLESNTKTWSPGIYSDICNKIEPSSWKKLGVIHTESGIWETVRISYEIACLLHDCGHAPFSHAFEDYYGKENIKTDICNEVNSCINDDCKYDRSIKNTVKKDFTNDITGCLDTQPHELVSAWLVLHSEGFRKNVLELGGEPLLIARMIIGCQYDQRNLAAQFLNCIIGLLNGHEIDADRIDYTLRDGWVSDRRPISLDKLIATIHINSFEENLEICYKKTVLPEIEGLVDAKNHSFFWIINHHKVMYDAYLLGKAVELLSLLLTNKNTTLNPILPDGNTNLLKNYLHARDEQKKGTIDSFEKGRFEKEALSHFFDYHSLIESKKFDFELNGEQYSEEIYLLSDGDIVYLLKKYFLVGHNSKLPEICELMDGINYAEEWFSRDHSLKAVWKNRPEYNAKVLEKIVTHKLNYEGGDPASDRVGKVIEKVISILARNPELQDLSEYLGNNTSFKELIKSIVHSHLIDSSDLNYYDIAKQVICKIRTEKENSYLKNNLPKVLTPEKTTKIVVREINYDKIYIVLDEKKNVEPVRLSVLDLPRKNIARNYSLYHVYLPKIYEDEEFQKEIDHQEYGIYHKEFMIAGVEEALLRKKIVEPVSHE